MRIVRENTSDSTVLEYDDFEEFKEELERLASQINLGARFRSVTSVYSVVGVYRIEIRH